MNYGINNAERSSHPYIYINDTLDFKGCEYKVCNILDYGRSTDGSLRYARKIVAETKNSSKEIQFIQFSDSYLSVIKINKG